MRWSSVDILFEFIVELAFDAAGTGAASAAGSRRVPKPVRYILLALILLVYTTFFAVIFLVAYILMRRGEYPAGAVFLALGAFLLFLSIRKFRALKEKVKNPPDEGENKGEEL